MDHRFPTPRPDGWQFSVAIRNECLGTAFSFPVVPHKANRTWLQSWMSNSMALPSAAIASNRGRSFFVLAISVLVRIASNSSAVNWIGTTVIRVIERDGDLCGTDMQPLNIASVHSMRSIESVNQVRFLSGNGFRRVALISSADGSVFLFLCCIQSMTASSNHGKSSAKTTSIPRCCRCGNNSCHWGRSRRWIVPGRWRSPWSAVGTWHGPEGLPDR